MVKILMIAVYNHQGPNKSPVLLAKVQDLSGFNYFTRGTVSQHIQFATRTVCQRTKAGDRQSVTGEGDNPFLVHCYNRHDNLAAVCVTDRDYPTRVVYSLISKTMNEYEQKAGKSWQRITTDQTAEPAFMQKDLIVFQEPNEADKLIKIQRSLDDVKDIMSKNLDEVLKRGETLDSLMDKSQDLSATSIQFYKKAKKQNQCCKAY